MRLSSSILALSVFASACAQMKEPAGSSPTGDVASARAASQFADDTLVNLVDPGHDASLLLTAGADPVTVEIFYLSGKTTDTGSDPGTVTLADTIALASNQTARHRVKVHDAAFKGGYGAIELVSAGGTGNTLFQTFVQYGGSMFSTGGSVFMGSSYRVPYWDHTLRVVLAITNQSSFPFDVQVSNVGTAESRTVTLPASSTYRFDSVAEGFNIDGTNSIQVLTSNGGVIALSGYLDRVMQRIRITPVKAAPYP